MVAAVAAVGDRPMEKRTMMFLDNNATAGALIKASSSAPIILALIESVWRIMASVAAACRVDREPYSANPADAPRSRRKLHAHPHMEDELASRQQALRWSQLLQQPAMVLGQGGGHLPDELLLVPDGAELNWKATTAQGFCD